MDSIYDVDEGAFRLITLTVPAITMAFRVQNVLLRIIKSKKFLFNRLRLSVVCRYLLLGRPTSFDIF